MPRKIYIASSWKNVTDTRALARVLRGEGHEAYDFTDPENFIFEASEPGQPREGIDWLKFLDAESTKKAYHVDKTGLDWADTVVLFLPAGRSAHLEAGYGVGAGKDLFIYGDLPRGEFDVMYLMAKGCYRRKDLERMIAELSQNGGKCENHLGEKG